MRISAKRRSRPRILFATLVSAILVGSLTIVPPATAAPEPAAEENAGERAQVVALWRTAGPTVQAAAARVLAGTDSEIHAFLTTELPRAMKLDERISVNRMLAAGGTTTKAAAQLALDSTSAEALTTFLKTGWQAPSAVDLRIRVNQMFAAGGPEVRKAAQAALDADTTEALQKFVEEGWKRPHENDLRIRVNQFLAGGGTEVKKIAQRSLDAGTVDAYNQFLDHDRAIAESRDEEAATIEQLANAAKDAGELATRETQAAKDASARAVKEAELAKAAAQAAAVASANAQGNAELAASAATQAAEAANNAAIAAKEAIRAANTTSSAARVAAGAASRAAAAALKAGDAASKAYSAAASAITGAVDAEDASRAAQTARGAAVGAEKAAEAAGHAGIAANNAKAAADSASAAGSSAADAARAAVDAGNNAAKAGANAAKARKAAADAQAAAARADRAARASSAFAAAAAAAAFTARDAANRAASDARSAADAAEDAAAHAGNATDAAQQATNHANAATQAAQASVAAANRATDVYKAARTADAERLAVETDQNVTTALSVSTAIDRLNVINRWNATQVELRSAETNRLIAEATAENADPVVAVPKARKVAMALASTGGGSWTKTAASDALAGNDAIVMEFVRVGIAVAAGQDDRTTLRNLILTGTEGFKTAAEAALAGSDSAVQAFLRSQDYPGRESDDRIAVNRVLATAQQNGSATLQAAAQKALDTGTAQALRGFLKTGQFSASSSDERIKANQILASPGSGPELKAAAQVALDGSAGMLQQFLAVGQYAAAQRDQDSATHNAAMAGHLARAAQFATTATQSANEAQATAATARGAAAEAVGYEKQAKADAAQASVYAQNAAKSARDAEASATQAAQSAATARNAANSAKESAQDASRSAAWATASERQAASFAAEAFRFAYVAFNAALDAGKSARDAATAASDAVDSAIKKVNEARGKAAFEQGMNCQQYKAMSQKLYDDCINLITASDFDKRTLMLANGAECERLYKKGTEKHQGCLLNVLSPSFAADQALAILQPVLDESAKFLFMVASIEAAGLCALMEPCGLLALSIVPEGTAFTSWLTAAGAGALAASRVGAMLERSGVETHATQARLAEALAGLLKLCKTNSFTGDTPILLSDMSRKPIKDIRVGDRVLATDPASGRSAGKPVTQLINGQGSKHLVEIRLADSADGSVLRTTDEHPFWNEDTRSWVSAKDLRPGSHLRNSSGTSERVASVRSYDESIQVFNFTVADLHTYYVATGATSVLVHNTGCTDIALGRDLTVDGISSLELFAWELGAASYKHWDRGTPWYQHILNAIEDGVTRIHFNLDGIPDPIKFANGGINRNPRTDFGHLTAWELNEIRNAAHSWNRVIFYCKGKVVVNPFNTGGQPVKPCS
ncbi:polymorphic toxin-type HINT domain-containing protein [Amycolatopsis orientalis]|uniref:polymorphic toxin-type HINT domain-containing protein n=1 Tax=Amycolatopsis orientalis TaxID=31958 RepID=UPI0011AB427D|nr:polymorphic toxin-type HINT domain-containing protein [Amycolatopsis orientalis]